MIGVLRQIISTQVDLTRLVFAKINVTRDTFLDSEAVNLFWEGALLIVLDISRASLQTLQRDTATGNYSLRYFQRCAITLKSKQSGSATESHKQICLHLGHLAFIPLGYVNGLVPVANNKGLLNGPLYDHFSMCSVTQLILQPMMLS